MFDVLKPNEHILVLYLMMPLVSLIEAKYDHMTIYIDTGNGGFKHLKFRVL